MTQEDLKQAFEEYSSSGGECEKYLHEGPPEDYDRPLLTCSKCRNNSTTNTIYYICDKRVNDDQSLFPYRNMYLCHYCLPIICPRQNSSS
jgi:hypothetical protein